MKEQTDSTEQKKLYHKNERKIRKRDFFLNSFSFSTTVHQNIRRYQVCSEKCWNIHILNSIRVNVFWKWPTLFSVHCSWLIIFLSTLSIEHPKMSWSKSFPAKGEKNTTVFQWRFYSPLLPATKSKFRFPQKKSCWNQFICYVDLLCQLFTLIIIILLCFKLMTWDCFNVAQRKLRKKQCQHANPLTLVNDGVIPFQLCKQLPYSSLTFFWRRHVGWHFTCWAIMVVSTVSSTSHGAPI